MATRKCKLKFILLDIFVVFFLVCAALFYILRDRGERCEVEYTLLFTVDGYAADAFAVGAPMLDAVGKGVCGHVARVEKSPAFLETEKGLSGDPLRTRAVVTVRGSGSSVGGVLRVGSISPAVGRHLFFHAPCVAEGICTGVRRL